jgi:AmiR/NasT family two-component response regulator
MLVTEHQEAGPVRDGDRRLEYHSMHLARTVEHARDIGIAMGIVMATEKLSRQGAFDRLRTVSQSQNRRVFLIAAEVIASGILPPATVRRLHGSEGPV